MGDDTEVLAATDLPLNYIQVTNLYHILKHDFVDLVLWDGSVTLIL